MPTPSLAGSPSGRGASTDPMYATSPLSAKVAEGRFFLMSSTLDAPAGTEATWQIQNGSSTKIIKIVHVSAATDTTSQIRFSVFKNSTITGSSTGRTPWDPNFATASTSVATVRDGIDIRSGGTRLEASVPAVRDAPYEFDGLQVLLPGQSLELTGVVPGSLSAQQLTVGARWYEDPV